MTNLERLVGRLPEPGAPPPRASALLWRYMATQWRRAFGLNVSRVDALLFVGGEFHMTQWPALYGLGVRAVLNLQAEREDVFGKPPPTRTLRLPVEDFHAPTIAQLDEAVAFVGAAHAEQLPVLIHCHAGVGRAALTACAYYMARGLAYAEAFARVQGARPIVHLNQVQRERLSEWTQVLRSRH